MGKTILLTLLIVMTFIVLSTTSPAYAQVSNFFWSEDDGTGEVFTADSATQTVSQVTAGGFDRIDDVEIDPLAGKLWWNNWVPGVPSPSEGLYNSNLDGSVQVQMPGLASSCGGFPSGLTGLVLDPGNLRLFYTRGVSYDNCPNGEVSRVNLDGTGYIQLDSPGGDSWHPDGIELSGNTIFWGDPGVIQPQPAGGAVNSMDTNGVLQIPNLVPHTDGHGRSLSLDAANGLLFYSSHNPAVRNSGGAIFVFDVIIGGPPIQVLNDPTTGIPDVELDTANMRIYWTDYVNGLIRSSSYDAAGNLVGPITNEISNLINPYGLALEFGLQPIGGTLVPIDTTALLLASLQSISMWMIPVVVAGIAIGVFVIKRRK